MKKLLSIIIWYLLLPLPGICQTYVGGGMFSTTVWTPSGNPYIVTSNLIVMTGVTLTLQPGVVLNFEDGTNIEVRGDLIANGTIADTILFTSNSPSPTPGIWGGIDFWNALNLYYVKISYASFALKNTNISDIHISHSTISFSNVGLNHIGGSGTETIDFTLFENNGTAIMSASDALHISNCVFKDNVIGIGNAFSVLISYCSFFGNTDKGLNGVGANYLNNLFDSNAIGVNIKLYGLQYQFKYNTIINNQIGVQARGDITSTPNTNFNNNTICNNTIYNIEISDNVPVYLQNNCWCTTDTSIIDDLIYDAHDNLALGLVFYNPIQTNCVTGISDDLTETTSRLYPNPVSNEGILHTNISLKNAEVSIYDITGKQISQIKNITGTSFVIPNEINRTGIYILSIQEMEGSISFHKITFQVE